jgi:hypothetical protein
MPFFFHSQLLMLPWIGTDSVLHELLVIEKMLKVDVPKLKRLGRNFITTTDSADPRWNS